MGRIWDICQLLEGGQAYDGYDFPKAEAVTQPDGLIVDYPVASGQYLTCLALFAVCHR